MTPRLASLFMPALRRCDPEFAHRLGLRALGWGLAGAAPPPPPSLATEALGLAFQSPLLLAAGFDKNAEAPLALLRLGFGGVEIGTVTPLAQPGNPRPRLFRLEQDRAVINRMGFNGCGAQLVASRLASLPRPGMRPGPIGINLGINKQHTDPVRDYAALATLFAPLADYLVINVSSPNTPGLRDLQREQELAAILRAVPRNPCPLLVKLAPDLSDDALPAIIETCVDGGVSGLIVSNTTTARPADLRSPHAGQMGGLSGAPLFAPSTRMLARAFRLADRRLVLIAAGGVFSGPQALAKLQAGADLVQLYTAFAYGGPHTPGRINIELADALAASGFCAPHLAVGTAADEWSRLA